MKENRHRNHRPESKLLMTMMTKTSQVVSVESNPLTSPYNTECVPIFSDDWLSHTLQFENSVVAVLAKDASTKQDDWYDVYDPRNSLNKRKRGDKEKGGSSRSSSNRK